MIDVYYIYFTHVYEKNCSSIWFIYVCKRTVKTRLRSLILLHSYAASAASSLLKKLMKAYGDFCRLIIRMFFTFLPPAVSKTILKTFSDNDV